MRKKFEKEISILCIVVCFLFLFGGRSYAMELNEEERKGKEKSHQRAAEYEMNMILEMLDIKEWRWPSLAMDEIDLPQDAPLGCYSPETLTQYIDTEEQISVKIDYYFGGFMPERHKETVQIFTIYKDGRQYRMGYVI